MRTTTAPVKTVISLTPGPDDVIGVHAKGCGQQFQNSAAGSHCTMFFSVLFVFGLAAVQRSDPALLQA